jgi:hypothetical protein
MYVSVFLDIPELVDSNDVTSGNESCQDEMDFQCYRNTLPPSWITVMGYAAVL